VVADGLRRQIEALGDLGVAQARRQQLALDSPSRRRRSGAARWMDLCLR
jgi:hypothetical protein